jgi:hypothetical protein
MHDHAHPHAQHPSAPGHSESGKVGVPGIPGASLLLMSAGARLGLAGSAVVGLWLVVLWAL